MFLCVHGQRNTGLLGTQAEHADLEASKKLFAPNILLDARQLFEIDMDALVFAHSACARCRHC